MKLHLGFLSRARLWQKFLLLGVVTLPAAVLPTYQVYKESKANIARTQTQLDGVEPAKMVVRLLQLVQQHRDMAASVIAGDKEVVDDLSAKSAKINGTIAELDSILRKDTDPQLAEGWRNVRSSWTRLDALSSDTSSNAQDTTAEHTELCSSILVLLAGVRDHYVMSLDPEFNTYYLNLAAFYSLPQAAEASALARTFGISRLNAANGHPKTAGAPEPAATGVTAADRARLSALIDSGDGAIVNANQNFEKVFFRMPRLRANIESRVSDTVDRFRSMSRVAHQQIIDGQAASYDADRYATEFSQGIEAQFALIDATADVLTKELGARIATRSAAEQRRIMGFVAVVSVALILGFFFVRGVTTRVGKF